MGLGRRDVEQQESFWVSASDLASARSEDGRFHLKYKAENAVDLDTEIIVAAEVYHGDYGDTTTIEDTVLAAQTHLREASTDYEIKEVVADKGYHSDEVLDNLQNESHVRTYIPEQERKHKRKWKGKGARREASYRRNRRNTAGERGRRLQRLRSERVERAFAHLCDTGGGRRTWLRGIEKVQKRYTTTAMAHNVGRIMHALFGAGKPRCAAVLAERPGLAQPDVLRPFKRLQSLWQLILAHAKTLSRQQPVLTAA